MDRTVTIPDALYAKLEASASQRGFVNIQQLLEEWLALEDKRQKRHETIKQIDALREKLYAKYGEMPDSTELIREDRRR